MSYNISIGHLYTCGTVSKTWHLARPLQLLAAQTANEWTYKFQSTLTDLPDSQIPFSPFRTEVWLRNFETQTSQKSESI